MDTFREAVWHAVPAGATPERLAPRRAFLLEHVRAGDRVLDLGCGGGTFAAALQEAGATVAAGDVARAAVDRARAAHPQLDVRRLDEDRELPWAQDAFDVVWLGEVLEHVVDTVLLLAEIRRVLRFGGTLLITTPAHGRVRTAVLALRPGGLERHFDPRADHLRFYTARSLAAVLRDAGFPDVTVQATDGPPLLRRALHAVAR